MNFFKSSRFLKKDEVDEIRMALTELRPKLNFEVAVSNDERRRLIGLGKSNLSFVEAVLRLLPKYDGFLPGLLKGGWIQQHYNLYKNLRLIEEDLAFLLTEIQETKLVIGNSVFKGCGMYYRAAQEGQRHDLEGAVYAFKSLYSRFERTKSGTKGEDEIDELEELDHFHNANGRITTSNSSGTLESPPQPMPQPEERLPGTEHEDHTP